MYAKVENSKVVSFFHRLPTSYENVSGFDLLSDSERIKQFGIFPVEEVYPELLEHQTYGDATVSVKSSKVVRTYSVRNMTDDEIASEKSKINAPILQQIEDLERQQIRPQGEILTALLNGTTPNQFAVDKLQQIEDAKAALRAQLL